MVATVVADVLQIAKRSVLMVDTADPTRSGLGQAARSEGPYVPGPHPAVAIRFSWRAQALLARVETTLPVLAPGMVPPPRFWSPHPRHLDATVVDIGHDPWRVAAHPLAGAGAWLRRGTPAPRPVLVVRPSIPSLARAEQVLARLEYWSNLGATVMPVALIVVGAKRWPSTVAGSAGRRVQALLPGAVFVPHDPDVAVCGVTAEVTPSRLRAAVIPLLRHWGVVPVTKPSQSRSGLFGRARGKGGAADVARAPDRGLSGPATATTGTTAADRNP
ncbi:hypothetical protein [Amycolatopsis anabasis]|uniref:hypothetical protein n=1 Tax=Amycolatopsis anabasis TaxID=1840409 RepID=UPI0015D13E0F|nr:hypothetical protein [Amycolatopsis anabasis]